jgi:hypothetical protein
MMLPLQLNQMMLSLQLKAFYMPSHNIGADTSTGRVVLCMACEVIALSLRRMHQAVFGLLLSDAPVLLSGRHHMHTYMTSAAKS